MSQNKNENVQSVELFAAKRFVKTNSLIKLLTAVILILSLGSNIFSQNVDPKSIVDSTPSKTDYFTIEQLSARMGFKPAATQSTSGNLPFQVDKNYPRFYVIPESRRSPILDQGNCGSCVAYSTTSALYTLLSDQFIPKGKLVPALMSDPFQFFVIAGRVCPSGTLLSGWYNGKAVEQMSKVGSLMSLVDKGENSFGATKTVNFNGYYVKVGKYGSTKDVDAMRSFISRHGAMTANMAVYPSFNKYKSGIYNNDKFVDMILATLDDSKANSAAAKDSLRTVREALSKSLKTMKGGHAVTVIGYFTGGKVKAQTVGSVFFPAGSQLLKLMGDVEWDLPAFWIVQNSWGKEWGMNGLFFIEAGNPKGTWERIDDEMYYMMDPVVTVNGKPLS